MRALVGALRQSAIAVIAIALLVYDHFNGWRDFRSHS